MQILSSRIRQTLFFFCSFCVLTVGAIAQPGVTILPDNIYTLSGNAGANSTVTPINISGRSFTQGYRIEVSGTSASISDAGLWFKTSQAVAKGDNLQLTFWVRKIDPIDGNNIRGFVGFEKSDAPYTKSLLTVFPCDSDVWAKYSIPFKSAEDFIAGGAQLFFHFAHGPQTFDIGGIGLTNLGKPAPVGTQPVSVLPENIFVSNFSYVDPKVGGSIALVNSGRQDFTQAFQLSTNGDSEFVYQAGLGWNLAAAVKKGDVLVLQFWVRKLEPVGGDVVRGQVLFERAGPGYDKSLSINFPTDSSEWKLYQIPFKAHTDFTVGEAHLTFQFAYGPQKFEIGGVALNNHGQAAPLAQFKTEYYYPGRGDESAVWRQTAIERINQIRKGNLNVIVRDGKGNPLPNAQVFIQQTSHAFRFGSAVTAQLLAGTGQTAADREIYRSRVSSHFTTTVLENDLKWPFWESWQSWNRQATMDALVWLKSQNLPVRGHNLIWPSSDNLPADARDLTGDALRARIDQHFSDILRSQYAGGKCYQWDVVNEPYSNYDIQGRIPGVGNLMPSEGKLGNMEIVRWFQMARTLDPQAKLFVNDYDILAAGGAEVNHQNYLFTLTRWMLDNGAPVDGVGMQGHFDRITPLNLMETIIKRYSTLPVQLAVTEFDVNLADEELQAEYTRDVMTMIFGQPRFNDFLMWGFWEKAHWLPLGAMYRADWTSKPNALVYNDLVFREWWTNANGVTDATGKYSARGFKGSYNVTAVYGRVSRTVSATIDNDTDLVVTLDMGVPHAPVRRNTPRRIDR